MNRNALSVNDPLILVGDFNFILSSDENRGGQPVSMGCKLFQSFIHQNDLRNLIFKGPQFTWRRGVIFERLDRAVGNKDSCKYFLKATVFHLPCLRSDHRPILISVNSPERIYRSRPFRLLASWVQHPSLNNFIRIIGNMDWTCLILFQPLPWS